MIASQTASRQKFVVNVLQCRQANTQRLAQSRTGEEIHEASTHGNVGDIRRPDVVRANDVQTAQEIGGDPMGRMPLRGAGHAIHGGDLLAPHVTSHTPPPNGVLLVPKQIAEHPGAGKRILRIQLDDPPHQRQRRLGYLRWLVVDSRAG